MITRSRPPVKKGPALPFGPARLTPSGRPPDTLSPMGEPFDNEPGRALRTDRRHAIRTEFRLGEASGLGEIRLDTRDLSVGGAFLVADLLFEVGEVLSLSFTLPESERKVQARGKVKWVSRGEEGGKPPGMGVEFLNLPTDVRDELEVALRDAEGDDPEL